MQSPKLALFRSLDGSDPDPRAGRDSIDVTLSEIPLIITGIAEIPIPQTSFDELIQRFDALLLAAEKRSVDTKEERYLFKEFLTGYPRNPGGNFEDAAFDSRWRVFRRIHSAAAHRRRSGVLGGGADLERGQGSGSTLGRRAIACNRRRAGERVYSTVV